MFDIYAAVTDRIIAELESGNIPWQKPWTGVTTGAIKRSDGRPYSLINQILLGKPGEWMTYKAAQAAGGNVKKGAHGSMVVFWKMLKCDLKDSNGNVVKNENGMPMYKSIPVLKYYTVFHIDDCEGIEPKWTKENLPATAEANEKADAIIDDYSTRAKLKIVHEKQNEAFYMPSKHIVKLPLIEQFADTSEYYSTTFHELVHSTGHKTLLNRFDGEAANAAFGSREYSKEELVAEIGACGILNEIGMETHNSFRNSAAYIQSWIRQLKNDKRMIISAASRAEKAIKLILNITDDNAQAKA